ncbi:hypothetical protein OCU04_011878 [Sclerotinia nivalis]|uniref:Uncharacterized protein n=1 Tax=Sclerotinia nivalis TaxID=352851 RepID=A0A9X0DDL0_9HELO|nr:hypothetical protein OCU04_011878 [Sclerotinia nivalis]
MAESETAKPLKKDDNDYYFTGQKLIPYFPVRGYHLNKQGFALPGERFKQACHLPPSFFKALKALPQEILHNIYEHIIDVPAIDPAAKHNVGESEIIPDLTYNFRQLNEDLDDDEIFKPYPESPYPIPVQALLLQQNPSAIYTPTGCDPPQEQRKQVLGAWKLQNSGDWIDHRSTQQLVESSTRCNGCQPENSYGQLVQFVYSVALHEDFQLGYNDNIWRSPSRQSSLLRNFLIWFWRKIEHLTLRFHTGPINQRAGVMYKNIRRFCEMIPATFPNLRKITYLNRNHHTEGYTQEKRCDTIRKGFSKRLIELFRAIPVSESIEVILDLYFGTWISDDKDSDSDAQGSGWRNSDANDYDDYKSASTDTPLRLHHRQLEVEDGIRRLLMPTSLLYGNTNDLPEDLGLRRLFGDLEP